MKLSNSMGNELEMLCSIVEQTLTDAGMNKAGEQGFTVEPRPGIRRHMHDRAVVQWVGYDYQIEVQRAKMLRKFFTELGFSAVMRYPNERPILMVGRKEQLQ